MVGHVAVSFRQWLYWHKSEKGGIYFIFHISWVTMAMTAISMKDWTVCTDQRLLQTYCTSLFLGKMWMMLTIPSEAILIAVIVKIFDRRGSKKFLNISHTQLLSVLSTFELQQSCDHTDSYDMSEDCTQDPGFNSSFIIHPRFGPSRPENIGEWDFLGLLACYLATCTSHSQPRSISNTIFIPLQIWTELITTPFIAELTRALSWRPPVFFVYF